MPGPALQRSEADQALAAADVEERLTWRERGPVEHRVPDVSEPLKHLAANFGVPT